MRRAPASPHYSRTVIARGGQGLAQGAAARGAGAVTHSPERRAARGGRDEGGPQRTSPRGPHPAPPARSRHRRLRIIRASAALLLLLAAPAGAAAARVAPFAPPLPELAHLVPWAAAPIDKPPAEAPELPLPPAPAELPVLPPAPIVVPPVARPTAFLAPPGTLPCVGAWLGIASKALECGRARFARGEWDDAAGALDQAVRGGKERELLAEARYWLAETYDRLGRGEQADWLFRQVVQTSPRGSDWIVWSRHASGWTALRLGDFPRARDAFDALLTGPVPASLGPWARHGLALAEYALGRYDEALAGWTTLVSTGPPAALARDVTFWLGEALGRVGRGGPAADQLARFVQGGPHPLLETGWLRLGWWGLGAGRHAESVTAFRTYLAPPATPAASPVKPEQDWAEAGLALALLPEDVDAARAAARGLERRASPLALPLQLRVARVLVEAAQGSEARALIQQLLGATLAPDVRAWVLLLNGDALRRDGSRDEARTQYDLARNAAGATGWVATVRLARTNYEMREFAQAARDLAPVFAASVPADVRLTALLLAGEAAYHAGDHAAAGATFRRVLVEFPDRPQAAAARLGVAWAALRDERADEARREFLDFVQTLPADPSTPDALELAAELTLKLAADREGARRLLDRLLAEHPGHPRAEFARLNRAILQLREGDAHGAAPELAAWIARAPFPPLLGRAHLALGVARLAEGRPLEAARAFTLAQLEGVGGPAALGLGATALTQGQLDAAAGLFAQARDTGTAAVVAAAEYGLAVVAFQRGAVRDFRQPALAALAAAPTGPAAPRLLYALTGVAVEARDFKEALAFARRLLGEFPGDAAADDALERVGAAAAAAEPPAWPAVYEAYTLLRRQYPASPFVEPSRLVLAEAALETGHAAEARAELEPLLAAAPAGPEAGRGWAALGRARAATGDRPGALEAYTRALTAGATLGLEARFGFARLLVDDRHFGEARQLLEPLLGSEDPALVARGAYGIADAWQTEGDQLAAAEYFMTAAYVAPASPAGRRALLGAAWSFLALKQPDAAATVYRKLLAQADVPADLAEAARKGLRDLGR